MSKLRCLSGYAALAPPPSPPPHPPPQLRNKESVPITSDENERFVRGSPAPPVLSCFGCVLPVDQVLQPLPVLFILFQLFLPHFRLLRRRPLQQPPLPHGLGLEDEAESWSCVLRGGGLGYLEACSHVVRLIISTLTVIRGKNPPTTSTRTPHFLFKGQ